MIPDSEKFLGATVNPKISVRILLGLSLLQVLFLLPAWQPGLIADNDFVAHVAWLSEWSRQVEQWGLGFHWTQRFNFGQPLLLFNLPPLSTFFAWILTKLGLNPVHALKLLLSASLVLTPWAMYWWHRMMMPKTRIVGLVAAAFSVLLANEFWGLGFHFSNGMVNAAISLPMVIGFFAAIEKLMAKPRHPTWWLGLAGFLYGMIVMTHLHSAFLAALFVLTIEVGRYFRHRNHGRLIRDLLSCGVSVVLGCGLSAFWLLPSLLHDARIDWLHIWSPPTIETVRAIVSGHLVSGLRSSSLNLVSVDSAVSAYLILALALVGIVAKLRRRRDFGLIAAFGLALWLTLGPGVAGPLKFMPFFERILHLRVASFLSIFLISLAARGAYACRKYRVGPLIFASLMVGIGLSALTISLNIKTESDFSGKRRDLEQVANWLDTNAKRMRVFSEFAGHSKEELSANYLRHMLPILADVQDGASFVYENSFSAKDFLRRGVYWGSVVPLIDLAPEYDIQFLIVWTSTAKRLLSDDGRWQKRLTSGDYEIYESMIRAGQPADDERLHLRLKQIGPNLFETSSLSNSQGKMVRTSTPYSPGWSMVGHEADARLLQDERGLLQLDLSRLTSLPSSVQLQWSADARASAIGRWISGSMLLICLMMVLRVRTVALVVEDYLLSRAERWLAQTRRIHVKLLGGVVVVACVGLQWQNFWQRDIARPFEGFGWSMDQRYADLVGTWRDFAAGYSFQLTGSRWQPQRDGNVMEGRLLSPRASNRQILPDIRVWTGDLEQLSLTLEFDSQPTQSISFAVGGPDEWRYFELTSAQKLDLPIEAVRSSLRTDASRPGKYFDIAVLNSTEVRFRRISVRNGIDYLQAEHFKQLNGDLDNQGSLGQWANVDLQQGLAMISNLSWPMTRHHLGFEVPRDSSSGCHEIWYLGIPAHGGQKLGVRSGDAVLPEREVAARKYGWIALGAMRLEAEAEGELHIDVPGLKALTSGKRVVITDALALVKTDENACGR